MDLIPWGHEEMTGCDSIGTKPTKARRWVLRSPGRKPTPTTTLGEQENLPANIAKPPPRGPSVSPREQAQQSQAQAKETSPSNAVLQAWNREHDSQKTTGAPRADKCLDTTTSDAGEASARPSDPLAGKAQGPSPFRLSRLRNKMLVPSAGLLKRFRRRSPNEVRGSYTIVEAREQRSPKGRATASCSIDTTAQDVELAYHSGGGGGSTPNDTWTSPVAEDGCLGEELVGEPCTASTAKAQSTQSHSSAQQHHATSDTGCRSINDLLAEGQHSETAIEREASRAHPSLGVGEDAISAIKTGKQPPRIAFIGVFLNGVAVALASFAPFGEVDARKALVKALLLESITVVRPGGCFTVRGSGLAVHLVVDQKHRVYACITAEDVPFSLGLSLLEEVQIEYVLTVATLAFSTKEHSHNTRCRAQMARSWAKYEEVERTLANERETRRLLGEAPRDIESPLGSSGTSIGVEVTPLQFTAEHQTVLLAASREILSLQEDGSNVADARTNSDDARLGSHKRPKAALLATGVTGLFAGLYAARHTVFPFLKFW